MPTEWEMVLGAATKRLAILIISGTNVPSKMHELVLGLICQMLPHSSLIALNVGEFDVASFDPLEAAIGHEGCVLGHLYYRDPVTPKDKGPKMEVRRMLRKNCFKPRYLDQLARDEVRVPVCDSLQALVLPDQP